MINKQMVTARSKLTTPPIELVITFRRVIIGMKVGQKEMCGMIFFK